MKKISHCRISPLMSSDSLISKTPINREQTDKISNAAARIMVEQYFLIETPPNIQKLVKTNYYIKNDAQ